jgi:hypothetical protein
MDRYLSLYDDPEFVAMDFMLMAVWGRKALPEGSSIGRVSH